MTGFSLEGAPARAAAARVKRDLYRRSDFMCRGGASTKEQAGLLLLGRFGVGAGGAGIGNFSKNMSGSVRFCPVGEAYGAESLIVVGRVGVAVKARAARECDP